MLTVVEFHLYEVDERMEGLGDWFFGMFIVA
jgi:hypothetical protein